MSTREAEFSGIRSKLYKESLQEFPNARVEDIGFMNQYLDPKADQTVLEVGAGSGFFSGAIADKVKKLIVTDPSEEQLQDVEKLQRKNIQMQAEGADQLNLDKESVDAIWSFGAMHHCFNKTKAFQNFFRILKPAGRIVIADVFHDSKLAKHFDLQVVKYCATGHEVAFWTNEFAESLCYVVGLQKPRIDDLDLHWKFETREEIGTFLYKIHAMINTTPAECLKGAEEILGISEKDGLYCLNWPMKMIITEKDPQSVD
jgi:arsenite methyltransferase